MERRHAALLYPYGVSLPKKSYPISLHIPPKSFTNIPLSSHLPQILHINPFFNSQNPYHFPYTPFQYRPPFPNPYFFTKNLPPIPIPPPFVCLYHTFACPDHITTIVTTIVTTITTIVPYEYHPISYAIFNAHAIVLTNIMTKISIPNTSPNTIPRDPFLDF